MDSVIPFIDEESLYRIVAGCLVLLALGASYELYKFRKARARSLELDKWIADARLEREMKVHEVLFREGNVDDRTHLSAAQTRELIVGKMLDPQQNIVNLSKRCRLYGRNEDRVNAIAEEFYQEAFETAASLKQFNNLDDAPPLYGVPVSVKDCIDMKEGNTTGGMACRLNKKDERDCIIMELCRKAGAIPLCRGNVVQVMMIAELYNRIWGRTRNPWDFTRSPGGSSGGDAALISMGCVPLSIAADGGGSVRIPASYCGIVGYKPTSNRLSFLNCMRPRKDNTYGAGVALCSVQGPMARTVEDCVLYMKAVCVPELWDRDRNIPPVPWNDKEYKDTKRLKIGYFDTDGWFEPCATSKRAVQETVGLLEKEGHTCVPFNPPTPGSLHLQLFIGILSAEGKARSFFEALEGEPIIPEYYGFVFASYTACMHRIIGMLDRRYGHCLKALRELSVYELWTLTGEMLNMRTKWSEAMVSEGIDALVFPSCPTPATTVGMSGLIASASYIFIAPLLMWPSGVVPVTTVRQDEQHYQRKDLPAGQRDIMSHFTAQIMKGSAGLPVGVSVMTTSFQDEKCLRVMREIEKLVKFDARPTAYKMEDEQCKNAFV